MDMVKNFKDGLDRMLHPDMNKDKMSIGDAMHFYYRVIMLPLVISIVLGFIFGFVVGSTGLFSLFGSAHGFGGVYGGVFGVVFSLIALLVFVPVAIIIDAAILQLFSKFIFKIWKGDISKTVTAIMFGELPLALFYWITFIPIVGLLTVILGLWGIYVTVVSLSKQHNISKLMAFVGWLIPIIVILVIEALLLSVFGLHLL